MNSSLAWRSRQLLPADGTSVIIRFFNDLGLFYAAGIFKVGDSGEPLFIDVLAGHKYSWDDLVVSWAEI